eukprot:jgi/Chlat1/9155/Chrsp97S08402
MDDEDKEGDTMVYPSVSPMDVGPSPRMLYKLVKIADDGTVQPATPEEIAQLEAYVEQAEAATPRTMTSIADAEVQRSRLLARMEVLNRMLSKVEVQERNLNNGSTSAEPRQHNPASDTITLYPLGYDCDSAGPGSLDAIGKRHRRPNPKYFEEGGEFEASMPMVHSHGEAGSGSFRHLSGLMQGMPTGASSPRRRHPLLGEPLHRGPSGSALERMSVRELHSRYRSYYGTDTSVKDKNWLKRRLREAHAGHRRDNLSRLAIPSPPLPSEAVQSAEPVITASSLAQQPLPEPEREPAPELELEAEPEAELGALLTPRTAPAGQPAETAQLYEVAELQCTVLEDDVCELQEQQQQGEYGAVDAVPLADGDEPAVEDQLHLEHARHDDAHTHDVDAEEVVVLSPGTDVSDHNKRHRKPNPRYTEDELAEAVKPGSPPDGPSPTASPLDEDTETALDGLDQFEEQPTEASTLSMPTTFNSQQKSKAAARISARAHAQIASRGASRKSSLPAAAGKVGEARAGSLSPPPLKGMYKKPALKSKGYEESAGKRKSGETSGGSVPPVKKARSSEVHSPEKRKDKDGMPVARRRPSDMDKARRKDIEREDEKSGDDTTTTGGLRRKHHRPWSLMEVKLLVEGVGKCGNGKWADIKKLSFASAGYRTAVDLKDKWRNLLRASRVQSESKGNRPQRSAGMQIPEPLLDRVRQLSSREGSSGGPGRPGRAPGHRGSSSRPRGT